MSRAVRIDLPVSRMDSATTILGSPGMDHSSSLGHSDTAASRDHRALVPPMDTQPLSPGPLLLDKTIDSVEHEQAHGRNRDTSRAPVDQATQVTDARHTNNPEMDAALATLLLGNTSATVTPTNSANTGIMALHEDFPDARHTSTVCDSGPDGSREPIVEDDADDLWFQVDPARQTQLIGTEAVSSPALESSLPLALSTDPLHSPPFPIVPTSALKIQPPRLSTRTESVGRTPTTSISSAPQYDRPLGVAAAIAAIAPVIIAPTVTTTPAATAIITTTPPIATGPKAPTILATRTIRPTLLPRDPTIHLLPANDRAHVESASRDNPARSLPQTEEIGAAPADLPRAPRSRCHSMFRVCLALFLSILIVLILLGIVLGITWIAYQIWTVGVANSMLRGESFFFTPPSPSVAPARLSGRNDPTTQINGATEPILDARGNPTIPSDPAPNPISSSSSSNWWPLGSNAYFWPTMDSTIPSNSPSDPHITHPSTHSPTPLAPTAPALATPPTSETPPIAPAPTIVPVPATLPVPAVDPTTKLPSPLGVPLEGLSQPPPIAAVPDTPGTLVALAEALRPAVLDFARAQRDVETRFAEWSRQHSAYVATLMQYRAAALRLELALAQSKHQEEAAAATHSNTAHTNVLASDMDRIERRAWVDIMMRLTPRQLSFNDAYVAKALAEARLRAAAMNDLERDCHIVLRDDAVLSQTLQMLDDVVTIDVCSVPTTPQLMQERVRTWFGATTVPVAHWMRTDQANSPQAWPTPTGHASNVDITTAATLLVQAIAHDGAQFHASPVQE